MSASLSGEIPKGTAALEQARPRVSKALLHRVLSIQTTSYRATRMHAFIKNYVTGVPTASCYEHEGNIYVTKGIAEVYPCIVAHTDTVHRMLPDNEFLVYEDRGEYFGWNPVSNRYTGVGGDDKVGIFIALAMLSALDHCKLVFFRDEEVGCSGSHLADLTFFDDCSFVLECDRKGATDFVDEIYGTELSGKEFWDAADPYLANHGYSRTSGGLTDVVVLKEDGLDIVAANMSCGYYNPHYSDEVVVFADVRYCHNLVWDLCTHLGDRRWKHVHVPAPALTYKTSQNETYEWDSKAFKFVKTPKYPLLTKWWETRADATEWSSKESGNYPTALQATNTQKSVATVAQLIAADMLAEAASEHAFDVLDGDDAWDGALAAALEMASISPDSNALPPCPVCEHAGYVRAEDDPGTYACINCGVWFSAEDTYVAEDDDEIPDYHVPINVHGYIGTLA